MNRLVTKMGLKQEKVNLHCYSKSVLHLGKNDVMDNRVKQIDIRYHFIKQVVFEGRLEVVKI